MQIIKNIRNDLLKRNEITALVESEKNPGFDEMKKQVSEQVGKSGENIEVFNIKGSFGSKEFKISVNVYDSKEDLEKNKMKTKKQRDAEAKGKEEDKAGGEKKEETKEEKPVDTGAPAEDKPEQIEQEVKTKEKPSEAPAEDKPEEEAKIIKEEEQVKEEAKED